MTLRGVIQGLLRGSDDAEAMLADEGYGDLPAEIFGQALSSYADTAPMDEADALSPVLTTIDAGDGSDVFAVLEAQPLTVDASGGSDAAGLGASMLGVTALDDALDSDAVEEDTIDDFGTAAPEDAADADAEAELAEQVDDLDEFDATEPVDADDPFAADDLFDAEPVADTAADFAEEADFFETEPTATNEDPSDLDF